MATRKSSAPSPSEGEDNIWTPPDSDQEFTFEGMDSAPAWVDKGWAGFDRGPALQVPAGDLYGDGPYHTKVARLGDKIVFTAAKGGMPARIDIIPGLPGEGTAGFTKKLPQASNVSLEDALKSGAMSPDDLGDDAKAQVAGRSPGLKKMVEEGKGAPDPVNVSETLKLS